MDVFIATEVGQIIKLNKKNGKLELLDKSRERNQNVEVSKNESPSHHRDVNPVEVQIE